MPMSLENRKKAGERLAAARAAKRATPLVAAAPPFIRPPEVQAVIDEMTPERRAKLEMIKARQVAMLQQTKEGQEALARAQEQGPRDPRRIGSREVRLIVKTDDTIVSVDGPCVCGKPKREWHTLCLKSES